MERIALVSDVHGNLTALEAVLADIDRRGISRIFNLGDYVGKGPRGREVVELCQERCEVNLLGNWDDFLPDPDREFDSEALRFWLDQLGPGQGEWLRGLPFSHDFWLSGRRVRLFHASEETVHRRVRYVRTQAEFEGLFTHTAPPATGPLPDLVGYADTHDPLYECQLEGRTSLQHRQRRQLHGRPDADVLHPRGRARQRGAGPVVGVLRPRPLRRRGRAGGGPRDGRAPVRRLRARAAPRHLPRRPRRVALRRTHDRLPREGSERMSLDFTGPLRDALVAADFTYDGVAGLLGEAGPPGAEPQRDHAGPAAYDRRQPARHPDPAVPPPGAGVRTRRPSGRCPASSTGSATPGLLEQSVGEVAARLDCRPYRTDDEDLWIVSDLTPGLDGAPNRVGSDHVLGISSASTSLAQLTIREPVGRALDLGTGCGVQALHLAAHAGEVVATDVNTRALWMTRLNAALNERRRSTCARGRSSSRCAASAST